LRDIPPALVQVMDRLLAHKPIDRYQSAAEAAEALQALTRPKVKKAAVAVPPRPAAPPPPKPAAPPPPSVVKVRPKYPGWFRPLAELAEHQPAGALAATIGALGTAFAVGFVLAWILL